MLRVIGAIDYPIFNYSLMFHTDEGFTLTPTLSLTGEGVRVPPARGRARDGVESIKMRNMSYSITSRP
jgi:hypothetical protein